jgi:hypothetical protein
VEAQRSAHRERITHKAELACYLVRETWMVNEVVIHGYARYRDKVTAAQMQFALQ